MKSKATILVTLLFVFLAGFGQPANSFKYQAIVRNSQGELITDQDVSFRISLLIGSGDGSAVYVETHSVKTTSQGLVNLTIGQGSVLTGNFGDIDWGRNSFFLKVEIDPQGGNSYTEMGVSPLLSVPYAIHAQTVSQNDDADADTTNELQSLAIKQDTLYISKGNQVDLLPYKDNTDAQQLTLTGTELSIEGGNTVDLAVIQDADTTDELQSLTIKQDSLYISKGNRVDLLPYKDNTDAQQLTLTGTELSIEGGNTVDLAVIQDGVDDADADPTNELQSLSINKDTLYLSSSNHVTLPKQEMIWDTTGNNIFYIDGSVGLGTNSINSSALLDINSGNKGVLVPRMTTIQRNAITSPANGLLVYDTNYGSFFYFNGTKSKWTLIPSMPTATSDMSEALFAVLNQNGDTVFAVYPEGVRINIADGLTKGNKGGFAVASIGAGTKTTGNEYFRITNDSIRMYVEESSTKGNKGGFAVASIGAGTKSSSTEIMRLTNDSVRIYLNESANKGNKGGFAVASIGAGTKGPESSNFFNIETQTNYIINPSEPRILWYPLKNAFLVGQVLIEHADSVGTNSTATGYESKAKGNYSQAFGYKAIARGSYSTAIGNNAVANSSNSFAFGDAAIVKSNDAYAFGAGALASGLGSYAFGSAGRDTSGNSSGSFTEASGSYAFAIGQGSKSSNYGAISYGISNVSSGYYSYSLGHFNTSSNTRSGSFGYGNISSGYGSIALGYNSVSSGTYSTALGYRAISTGNNAVATGSSTASGYYSFSFGSSSVYYTAKKSSGTGGGTGNMGLFLSTEAIGNGSVAIGKGVKAQAYASIVLGQQNITSSTYSSTAWVTTDPLFVIGNGKGGTISGPTQKNALTILKNGYTGIGTDSPDYYFVVYNGSTTGRYTTSGWTHSSDIRLKENIENISNALSNVVKLQGVKFNFISDSAKTKQIGFIAQDFEKVIPECVVTDQKGFKSISYGQVSAVLVEAIKEQQIQISKQQSEIDDLKAELEAIKTLLGK